MIVARQPAEVNGLADGGAGDRQGTRGPKPSPPHAGRRLDTAREQQIHRSGGILKLVS
ncbi:hypothetical protein [Micromonospora chokoriensis]|uniref:hypothetical protein n=1 Tax=Micromonospora chokoriensis TaxID=356851 RepID=UPI000A915841|nr:hypothetical protein [Micromonospora chokoriensis]